MSVYYLPYSSNKLPIIYVCIVTNYSLESQIYLFIGVYSSLVMEKRDQDLPLNYALRLSIFILVYYCVLQIKDGQLSIHFYIYMASGPFREGQDLISQVFMSIVPAHGPQATLPLP